jgi:two-component system OmpR family response regulator
MINLYTLSVDDEPDIREIVELSLGLDPIFLVRQCPSGHEALRAAIEWRPDLILLDVMMPVMDGPATLAELRADRRTAMIPVVFMTARAQMQEQARFKALGAAGVIAKPFDPMRLPAQVRDCLSAANAPAEDFVFRLNDAFAALAACRSELALTHERGTLVRIKDIAQTLAGTSRIYGFAGISFESTALEEAADGEFMGRGGPMQVEDAIDRVLARIATQ